MTKAVDLISFPLTIKLTAIIPLVKAFSVLHSEAVQARIGTSVCPVLFAHAFLEIIEPVAVILCSILVCVSAITICFVLLPLPLVDVTISMPEFSLAVCFVIVPLAMVAGTIAPLLNARPVSILFVDVALVLRTILEHHIVAIGKTFVDCLYFKLL